MDHQPLTTFHGDEINFRELWQTLVKRKFLIAFTTLLFTMAATIYAWTTKPTYTGKILIEVGEVINNNNQVINNNQPTTIFNLDNINNLQAITMQETGLTVEAPNQTTNILKISMESTNFSEIKPKLEQAVDFILTRHQEKAKLYQNNNAKIRMTQMIGTVHVDTLPIKPKKQLIITTAIIGGLIFGIFLALFLEFILTKFKEEK